MVWASSCQETLRDPTAKQSAERPRSLYICRAVAVKIVLSPVHDRLLTARDRQGGLGA